MATELAPGRWIGWVMKYSEKMRGLSCEALVQRCVDIDSDNYAHDVKYICQRAAFDVKHTA
jgi:hypothetical protein